MMPMHRTEVVLEPDLVKAIARLAERRNMSRDEVIREASRGHVAEQSRSGEDEPIFGIIGIGHGCGGDVAGNHDDFLSRAEMEKWQW